MARIKISDQIIIEHEEKLEADWNFCNNLLGEIGQPGASHLTLKLYTGRGWIWINLSK
jgi:hypothetical protein